MGGDRELVATAGPIEGNRRRYRDDEVGIFEGSCLLPWKLSQVRRATYLLKRLAIVGGGRPLSFHPYPRLRRS